MSVRWKEVQAIVDNVHGHAWGHASLTDTRLLLERNNLWTEAAAEYVSQIIENCTVCPATAPPQPSRKVSTSTLSRNFNEIVCVDHFFYLESVRLLHCMEVAARFSAAFIVESASIDESVFGFQACWLSPF